MIRTRLEKEKWEAVSEEIERINKFDFISLKDGTELVGTVNRETVWDVLTLKDGTELVGKAKDWCSVKLNDGTELTGTLEDESDEQLVVKLQGSGEKRTLALDDVEDYEVTKTEIRLRDSKETRELEPDEIDSAKPESSTTIEIGDFVAAREIDPIYFEKSYFLEPTDVGAKAFSLLRRALDETDRVALARVTIRTRERLATVRTYDGTLVLETMFWPDEIRSTGALDLPEGIEILELRGASSFDMQITEGLERWGRILDVVRSDGEGWKGVPHRVG